MEIRTSAGVELAPLPITPSPDYMAGADGRIYSRARHVGYGRWKQVAWFPLAGGRSRRLQQVVIHIDGRRIFIPLAKMICAAFHGLPPKDRQQVRYLDGDPANTRPANLAWTTCQEAWASARRARPAGECRRKRRVPAPDREHIRWAVAVGLCSQRQAARTLGISLSTVQVIVHEQSVPSTPAADPLGAVRALAADARECGAASANEPLPSAA